MDRIYQSSEMIKDSAGNAPGTAGSASVRAHGVRLSDCMYCGTLFRASHSHDVTCSFCQKEMVRQSVQARATLEGNGPLPF